MFQIRISGVLGGKYEHPTSAEKCYYDCVCIYIIKETESWLYNKEVFSHQILLAQVELIIVFINQGKSHPIFSILSRWLSHCSDT